MAEIDLDTAITEVDDFMAVTARSGPFNPYANSCYRTVHNLSSCYFIDTSGKFLGGDGFLGGVGAPGAIPTLPCNMSFSTRPCMHTYLHVIGSYQGRGIAAMVLLVLATVVWGVATGHRARGCTASCHICCSSSCPPACHCCAESTGVFLNPDYVLHGDLTHSPRSMRRCWCRCCYEKAVDLEAPFAQSDQRLRWSSSLALSALFVAACAASIAGLASSVSDSFVPNIVQGWVRSDCPDMHVVDVRNTSNVLLFMGSIIGIMQGIIIDVALQMWSTTGGFASLPCRRGLCCSGGSVRTVESTIKRDNPPPDSQRNNRRGGRSPSRDRQQAPYYSGGQQPAHPIYAQPMQQPMQTMGGGVPAPMYLVQQQQQQQQMVYAQPAGYSVAQPAGYSVQRTLY